MWHVLTDGTVHMSMFIYNCDQNVVSARLLIQLPFSDHVFAEVDDICLRAVCLAHFFVHVLNPNNVEFDFGIRVIRT